MLQKYWMYLYGIRYVPIKIKLHLFSQIKKEFERIEISQTQKKKKKTLKEKNPRIWK